MKKAKKEVITPYYRGKLSSAYIALGGFLVMSPLLISYAFIANNPSLAVFTVIFEILLSIVIILKFSNVHDLKYPKNKEKDARERNAINLFAQIFFKIERVEDQLPEFKKESFNAEEEFTLLTIFTELNQIKEKFHKFDLNEENIDINQLSELLESLMLLEIKLEKFNSNLA